MQIKCFMFCRPPFSILNGGVSYAGCFPVDMVFNTTSKNAWANILGQSPISLCQIVIKQKLTPPPSSPDHSHPGTPSSTLFTHPLCVSVRRSAGGPSGVRCPRAPPHHTAAPECSARSPGAAPSAKAPAASRFHLHRPPTVRSTAPCPAAGKATVLTPVRRRCGL